MKKSPRLRLDQALLARGLVESLKEAQAFLLAGEVKVDGSPAQKAGALISPDARIELATRQKFASRAGLKLEAALADFSVDATGLVCLDIGSSTGGFTDCLLQHGAQRIYAVDVNVSQLAWSLQQHPRVLPLKRNARELLPRDIPEPVALVTADVSFISVCKVLPPAVACAAPKADFLILIKPQFELRRMEIPVRGIVTDPQLHQRAIATVKDCAAAAGLQVLGVLPSRLTGAAGNQEFFLHACKPL